MDDKAIELARHVKAWWDARPNSGEATAQEHALVCTAKSVLGDWDNCAVAARGELDAYDLAVLARRAGAEVHPAWVAQLQGPLYEAPSVPITVTFTGDAPRAWEELMSRPTQLRVSVQGTRVSSPSGAVDGTLKACYALRLQTVNAKRRKLGLADIRN